MEREERYVVIKLSDIEKALELGHINQSNIKTIDHILTKIWYSRAQRGKEDLKTVVVEHDWPEYEKVWEMLEKRIDSEDVANAEYNRGWDAAILSVESGKEPFLLRGVGSYCEGWNAYMRPLKECS